MYPIHTSPASYPTVYPPNYTLSIQDPSPDSYPLHRSADHPRIAAMGMWNRTNMTRAVTPTRRGDCLSPNPSNHASLSLPGRGSCPPPRYLQDRTRHPARRTITPHDKTRQDRSRSRSSLPSHALGLACRQDNNPGGMHGLAWRWKGGMRFWRKGGRGWK